MSSWWSSSPSSERRGRPSQSPHGAHREGAEQGRCPQSALRGFARQQFGEVPGDERVSRAHRVVHADRYGGLPVRPSVEEGVRPVGAKLDHGTAGSEVADFPGEFLRCVDAGHDEPGLVWSGEDQIAPAQQGQQGTSGLGLAP